MPVCESVLRVWGGGDSFPPLEEVSIPETLDSHGALLKNQGQCFFRKPHQPSKQARKMTRCFLDKKSHLHLVLTGHLSILKSR